MKTRSEHRHVRGVSILSGSSALSGKECLANGQMTKASDKMSTPPPPPPPPIPIVLSFSRNGDHNQYKAFGRHEDSTELFASLDRSLAGALDDTAIVRAEQLVFRKRGISAATAAATAAAAAAAAAAATEAAPPAAAATAEAETAAAVVEEGSVPVGVRGAGGQGSDSAARLPGGLTASPLVTLPACATPDRERGAQRGRLKARVDGREDGGGGEHLRPGTAPPSTPRSQGEVDIVRGNEDPRRLGGGRGTRSKTPPPLPPRPRLLSKAKQPVEVLPEEMGGAVPLEPPAQHPQQLPSPAPVSALVPALSAGGRDVGGVGASRATNLIVLDGLRLVWTLEIRDSVVSCVMVGS